MKDYIIHQSEYIVENLPDIMEDLDIAARILNKLFPNQDTTWLYGQYNIFSITAPSTNFYKIYKELSDVIRSQLGTTQPLWIQAWMNYHREDQLLKWHAHDFDYHGYICIDPKKTKTVFDGYEIENKPGQIYFGPGKRFHKVESLESFTDVRTTIGFDVHCLPNNPLIYNYIERPYDNLGLIPLL